MPPQPCRSFRGVSARAQPVRSPRRAGQPEIAVARPLPGKPSQPATPRPLPRLACPEFQLMEKRKARVTGSVGVGRATIIAVPVTGRPRTQEAHQNSIFAYEVEVYRPVQR